MAREYARRRPETTFIMMPSLAQELTLTDPAPNVFRFADAAQSMAGLGSHAYRQLGWRRPRWSSPTTFLRLAAGRRPHGGVLCERRSVEVHVDTARRRRRGLRSVDPEDVDGVFLAAGVAPLVSFLERYSRRTELSRRSSRHPPLLRPGDPAALCSTAAGNGRGGWFPWSRPTDHGLCRGVRARIPALPAETALNPLAIPYPRRREAALQALEQVGGDVGERRQDFPAGARRIISRRLPGGSGSTRTGKPWRLRILSRVDVTTGNGLYQKVRTLRVVRDVEQTYGGYFQPGDPPPSRTAPACKKGNPPPWAKR